MQKSEKALFEEPYEVQLFTERSSTRKSLSLLSDFSLCPGVKPLLKGEITTTIFTEPFHGQLEM